MSLYKQFKTDEKVEKEGVWLEYGSAGEDKPVRIKIARAGGTNSKFLQLLEKRSKPYRRQIQTETIDPKVAENLFMDVYAEAVVLGWENVTAADLGETHETPLEFTKENCLKLFKALPDLFADLREQANRVALFRLETREADAGN